MLIYEKCAYLKPRPISVSISYDKSDSFNELYHFHPGIELIYVHSGTGSLLVEQHRFDIRPGTLVFIKPFQPHYLSMNITRMQPYVRTLIKYEPHYFSEYLKAFPTLHRFHNYLWNDPNVMQVQSVPNPGYFEHFLTESYERHDYPRSADRMEGHALFLVSLYTYLISVWESYNPSHSQPQALSPVIVQVMKWIDEFYDQEYHHEELARAVHLSPSHLSFLFNKATGKTITEFLTVRRLKQACLLLKTTTLPIQEIGRKSGWPNFAYFCQVFKKHMGMTPKKYRSN